MSVLSFDRFIVARRWLYIISGVMWGAVGVMLCRLAYRWLSSEALRLALPLALIGLAAAAVIYRFGFARVADKNIRRIAALGERAHLLTFQSGKSYLTIAIMMTMGITLRRSAFPKPYLAVLYEGIGGGLFLASLRYYAQVDFRS